RRGGRGLALPSGRDHLAVLEQQDCVGDLLGEAGFDERTLQRMRLVVGGEPFEVDEARHQSSAARTAAMIDSVTASMGASPSIVTMGSPRSRRSATTVS